MPQENIILAFDICSSTSIIEDLHRTQTVYLYKNLIYRIRNYLENNSIEYHFQIYKFLGDGYILIFEPDVLINRVLLFTIGLTDECDKYLTEFIEDCLEDEVLPRKGITIGLDKGTLYRLQEEHRDADEEFIGRPITIACRLQAKLDGQEHKNKVLMSLRLYRELSDKILKSLCTRTTRTLRNINDNKELKCYEFNPLYTRDQVKSELRKPAIENLKKIEEIYPDAAESIRSLYAAATAQTVISGHIFIYKNDQ